MFIQTAISAFWTFYRLLSILPWLHITIIDKLRATIKTITTNEKCIPLLSTLLRMRLVLLLSPTVDIHISLFLFQIQTWSSLVLLFLVSVGTSIHGVLTSLKTTWIIIIDQIFTINLIESARMIILVIYVLQWISISRANIIQEGSLRLIHAISKVMLTLSQLLIDRLLLFWSKICIGPVV